MINSQNWKRDKMNPFKIVLFMGIFAASGFAVSSVLAAEMRNVPQALPFSDNKLHIYLCGTGTPELAQQEIRKPSCLGVIANNDFMLFDAGESSDITLAGLGLPVQDVSNIFITHWHSDHMGGLGAIINETWIEDRKKPLIVYGPEGVNQVIAGLKQAYTLDASYRKKLFDPKLAFGVPKTVKVTKNANKVYADNTLTVSSFEAKHEPVNPALGYIINYQGCKIVISGDTRINPILASNAKNADLLINEAFSHYSFYNHDGPNLNPNKLKRRQSLASYHSDSLELAKMAKEANVKNLVLTHLNLPNTIAAERKFVTGMDDFYTNKLYVGEDKDEITVSKNAQGACVVTYISKARGIEKNQFH